MDPLSSPLLHHTGSGICSWSDCTTHGTYSENDTIHGACSSWSRTHTALRHSNWVKQMLQASGQPGIDATRPQPDCTIHSTYSSQSQICVTRISLCSTVRKWLEWALRTMSILGCCHRAGLVCTALHVSLLKPRGSIRGWITGLCRPDLVFGTYVSRP